jgi:PAS domain-containing protein
VADDAQHILQRALLGEAMDCAEGTAVFVWNEERKYVAVNEQACRLVGLSIARAYAQAHRGDLRYERGQPSGARFVIELPSV